MKNNNSTTVSRMMLILSMLIFGTIGIFRRYIPLSSGVVAFFRSTIGLLFIAAVLTIKRKPLDIKALKQKFIWLILSGTLLGLNWILLFEAYRYTDVGVATLCYYMAPIIIILVSPIVLKERLTLKKSACIVIAAVGMVFVSGATALESNDLRGILLGFAAALFYAGVVIINKKLTELSPYDKTAVQMAVSAVLLFVYVFFTEDVKALEFDAASILLLLVVGVIHTGLAYTLYFSCVQRLQAHTVALFSYIDPVIAVVLSAVLLEESMGALKIIGAVLIIGSAVLGEVNFKKHKLHTMRLDSIPFEKIKSGTKTIEMRLYDEKRSKIKVGDKISFVNRDTKAAVTAKVTALHRFDSFNELYASLPLLKCGYNEEEVCCASPDDMLSYYPVEKQHKYGVIGIEIKV